ncbi:MAG: copper oxidase, partial [Glaciihabitans sp.]|nr:copper oxidase [Glaciihabitans sp.]
DFSGGRGFDQIASDGGLLDRPVPMTALQLSPGERAEILVSVSAVETVVLRSEQPKLGRTSSRNGTNGSKDRFDVLQLRASGRLVHKGGIPTALEHVERIDASSAATTRKFTLEGHEINGEQMAMNRIDAVVTLGTTEIWDVTNTMETPHNFHVHDLQFQILDIDGSAPPPGLAGWKDTVYLPPNSRFRLIMQFTDYADPDHPYMFHCHFLRHEDGGMMGQFIVVEPGQELPGKWDTESGAVGSHDMRGMDMGTGN